MTTNTITEGGTITRSSTTSDTKELVDNDTDVDGSDNRTNFKVVVARKGERRKSWQLLLQLFGMGIF